MAGSTTDPFYFYYLTDVVAISFENLSHLNFSAMKKLYVTKYNIDRVLFDDIIVSYILLK